MAYDLITHLHRQAAWSHANFGPGRRTGGVVDHVREELIEIEDAAEYEKRVVEWADVVILGCDGLLREIATELPHLTFDQVAERAVKTIVKKMLDNERRRWPDWRGKSEDEPINHIRED